MIAATVGVILWMLAAPAAAERLGPPPSEISGIFRSKPGGVISIEAFDPGRAYRYETSEKDPLFAVDRGRLRFRRVELSLSESMPSGTVLADMAFFDEKGSRAQMRSVDLMKLIPKLDSKGALQLPEYLLAEYNRFGVNFRREHREFELKVVDPSLAEAAARVYRAGIWNNCLEPGKWEMTLETEDYGDFAARRRDRLNLNQDRTLAHSWFYLDKELYLALLRLKNPGLDFDPDMAYEELLKQAEQVVVDLDGRRRVKGLVASRVLEIGHKSGRRLVPLDAEQHYKWEFGLILNKRFSTYADVLTSSVALARFDGRGLYQTRDPKVFDYGWMRELDDVRVETLDVPGSDSYVQLTIQGRGSPFKLVLGNVDLALLDEQRLMGLLFGVNTYPKSRRHDPHPDTIQYDPDRIPERIMPYLFLIDGKTDKWGNNHEKGIEKVYLAWQDNRREVLEIYVLSYERIVPVWMARIRLDDAAVDRARVRRQLYAY